MPTPEHPSLSVSGAERMIVAARTGEVAELGVLLNFYRGYLLAIAGKKLPKDLAVKSAPSDLVQETLTQAIRRFIEFRGSSESEFRAWLQTILARKVIDVARQFRNSAKRDISREVSLHIDSTIPSLPTIACAATASDRATERLHRLQRALETLSEEHRSAIQLRSFEQLGFEEIGKRLGRTADAARKLWGRAIQNLTVELQSDDSGLVRKI